MNIKQLFIILGLIILLQTDANAFNGKRKGFLLGGGIGITSENIYTYKNTGEEFKNNDIAFDLHLGWGLSNKDILILGSILNYSNYNNTTHMDNRRKVGWRHYYNDKPRSFSSFIGLSSSASFSDNYNLLLGGGFTFIPHVRANLFYTSFNDQAEFRLMLFYDAF